MEDVLDVYKLPYDENCPVICLDEKPYQLLDEILAPIPIKQGKAKRIDNEYKRMGTCSIFVMCEPLKGWHHANARERRTAVDFAHEVDWLLTESKFKDAPKIKLVTDNLNTHNTASFYKAFPPEKAREMSKRIEWRYTPKKGSWLNIAEISISILAKQCIDRRIPNLEILNAEIEAWEVWYNSQNIAVNWQFNTEDARVKLHRLYPVF
jgi:hypothetical protein